MPIAVILDANVLIPAAPRDTILRAAERGLCTVRWTPEILEETRRNLVRLGITDARRAQRLVDTLLAAFPGAVVRDFEHLIGMMTNDPGDRHVLAAAVAAKVDAIVTSNLRHFPPSALQPFGMTAISPDDFLTSLYILTPEAMAAIVTEQAAHLVSPPITARDVLYEVGVLAPRFARLVREHLGLD